MLIPIREDLRCASPYMRVCVDDPVAPMQGVAPVSAHLLRSAASSSACLGSWKHYSGAMHEYPRMESPTRDAVTWGDARLPLQPPIFHYLGHLPAHPTWEQNARDDFVGTAAVDLARYQYLPLNAFERVPLLNTSLIPRWTYRTLFLPNDSMFKAMDSPGTGATPYMAHANCAANSPCPPPPPATHRCRPRRPQRCRHGTRGCPRAVRPNPTDSVLRNQVGYTGAWERTSRRDGRASQEASHRRAVRTWDRPPSYHTRSWAVKYLDQCLCSTAADPGAQ